MQVFSKEERKKKNSESESEKLKEMAKMAQQHYLQGRVYKKKNGGKERHKKCFRHSCSSLTSEF